MPSIRSGMNVIGADGVHIGTVDEVVGRRVRITKADSRLGARKGQTYYIDIGLVVEVDRWKVRLFVNSAVAVPRERGG